MISRKLQVGDISPMAPVSISDERAVSVSAERVWKVFSDAPAMPKVCAGFIDAIEVEGDGGAGTVTTMKLNPGMSSRTTKKYRLPPFPLLMPIFSILHQ